MSDDSFVIAVRWENQLSTFYDDDDFKLRMRANRSTFQQLVSYLRGDMEKKRTNWKVPVPVEKRIAAALYFMGHGGDLQRAADDFDISISLFHKIFKEFVEAVIKRMGHLLSWPSSVAEMREIMNGFWERRHLPGLVVEQSIVPISLSHLQTMRRQGHTLTGQAIRASSSKLLLIAKGGFWMCLLDGLAQCMISECLVSHYCLSRSHVVDCWMNISGVQVQGKEIGAWLVGDAGYALKPWMIVPYPGHDLPKSKKDFNFRQSSTRIIVEQAFGRLKGRFRLLNGVIQVADSDRHADIVVAACILHNLSLITTMLLLAWLGVDRLVRSNSHDIWLVELQWLCLRMLLPIMVLLHKLRSHV